MDICLFFTFHFYLILNFSLSFASFSSIKVIGFSPQIVNLSVEILFLLSQYLLLLLLLLDWRHFCIGMMG